MKILALGDLHGKFPKKFKKIIQKEAIDLIIGVGDYPDSTILRNLEFKHWEKLKKEYHLPEILGKKYKKVIATMISSMRIPLNALASTKKPIITVYGNSDILDKEARAYGYRGIETVCKHQKIILLKTATKKINGITFAGFSGYRGATAKSLKKTTKKRMREITTHNNQWEKRLQKLFSKIKREEAIIIAHDVPRGYFDKVLYKKSPMYGKHVGDEYFIKYIEKYQPVVFLCGHMHEYQGMKKCGKTMIINVGDGAEGKGAILNIPTSKKEKIKITFIK